MFNIGHYNRKEISNKLIANVMGTYNSHYDNTLFGAKVSSSVRKTARDLGMSQNLVYQILKDYRGIGEDISGIKLRDEAKKTFEREIAYNLGCYGVGRDEVSQIENILSEIQGRFHASGAEVRKAVDKFYDSSAGNIIYFPSNGTLHADPNYRIRPSGSNESASGHEPKEERSNVIYLDRAKQHLRTQAKIRVTSTNENYARNRGNLRRRLTNAALAVLAAVGIFSPNIDSKFDNVANAFLMAPLKIERVISSAGTLIEPYTLDLNGNQYPPKKTITPAQNTCLDDLVTDDKFKSAKLVFPELTDKMNDYINSHRNQIITQSEFNSLDPILQGWYAGQVKVDVVKSDNDQKTISVVYSVNDKFNSSFEKSSGCKLHLIQFEKNGREVIEFNKPIEYVLSADEYNRWTNSGRLPYVVAVVSPNKTNADGVFDLNVHNSFQYVLRPKMEKEDVVEAEREAEVVPVPKTTTLDLSRWGEPVEAWIAIRGK